MNLQIRPTMSFEFGIFVTVRGPILLRPRTGYNNCISRSSKSGPQCPAMSIGIAADLDCRGLIRVSLDARSKWKACGRSLSAPGLDSEFQFPHQPCGDCPHSRSPIRPQL